MKAETELTSLVNAFGVKKLAGSLSLKEEVVLVRKRAVCATTNSCFCL